MLTETQPELLNNMVEVDESYVGGKNKNRHADKKVKNSQGRSSADKTPVVGLVERGGKVVTFVTTDTNSDTLSKFIRSNVAVNAIVVTDAYKAYNGISEDYKHITVKHEDGGYVVNIDGEKYHTQNIENFWSQSKRGYVGIYHYMSPKHLQRYCNEFATRYNNRNICNIDRFKLVVKNSGQRKITYDKLTRG